MKRIASFLSLGAVLALTLVAGAWGNSARPTISVSPAPTVAPAASAAATNAVPRVSRDGVYYSKDDVAAYIFAFGCLPTNFITKAAAQRLGWMGGPLEPYAPGKAIGGDHFGNYERKLPFGRYRECDIDTLRRSRGAKRLIFSNDRRVYYTDDHYRTFRKVERK